MEIDKKGKTQGEEDKEAVTDAEGLFLANIEWWPLQILILDFWFINKNFKTRQHWANNWLGQHKAISRTLT